MKLANQFALFYSNDFDSYKNQLLLMGNTSLGLLNILLEQMENYIELNKNDFEKYHRENYRADSQETVSVRNLRPTDNTDFYTGWKNYMFGGV